MSNRIQGIFKDFQLKVLEQLPEDLPDEVMDFFRAQPTEIGPAIRAGLMAAFVRSDEPEATPEGVTASTAPVETSSSEPVPAVPAARVLKLGDIVEFEVDCDKHTPELVKKLRGIGGTYQGEKLTGRHWFKVQLTAAPRRFTNEESVEWAKTECGGIGVLPGQVAEDFRQKFPTVARLGVVPFSGGFWRRVDGIRRSTVFLHWSGGGSYLYDGWYNPTHQWLVGSVFPVVLEHKKL